MEKGYKQDNGFSATGNGNGNGNSTGKIDQDHAGIMDPAGMAGKRDGLEMGSERRLRIERRLKLKLDARFSILV